MSKIKFVRDYPDYQSYLDHQAVKSSNPSFREQLLGPKWEARYGWFFAKFRRTLKEIGFSRNLKYRANYTPAKKALCLGARYGHEVQALIDLGYQALGIDLVAHEPLVLPGDIHALAFDSESQDVVFTNIFDHSIDPQKFADEIFRVLKVGGVAIIHLAVSKSTDEFGVIEIEDSSPIRELFDWKPGYIGKVIIDRPFARKWGGLNWELVIQKIETPF